MIGIANTVAQFGKSKKNKMDRVLINIGFILFANPIKQRYFKSLVTLK